MNKITIILFAMLLPGTCAEIAHTPTEVSEGTTFTAWIDTENDVESVTFYVCTLEEPHTCYKPQKMLKNESQNGRFQFEYLVKSNDYPGYKYELEKKDKTIKGFNIGNNSGEVSGQTIFHCHIHLIPRRKGDVKNPRGGVRHVISGKGDYKIDNLLKAEKL